MHKGHVVLGKQGSDQWCSGKIISGYTLMAREVAYDGGLRALPPAGVQSAELLVGGQRRSLLKLKPFFI